MRTTNHLGWRDRLYEHLRRQLTPFSVRSARTHRWPRLAAELGPHTEVRTRDEPRSVSSVNTHTEPDEESEWEEPTRPGPPPPPPIPTSNLPAWIRDHVESVAAFTQTPPGMAVMFGLAGLSTALANKGEVRIRSEWTEPLHIWTMTILEPANRKSAVLKPMLEPAWKYERERVRAVAEARRDAEERREALDKTLKKKRKERAQAIAVGDGDEERELSEQIDRLKRRLAGLSMPDPGRLIADDVTPEALLQLMAQNNGRAAILSAEGEIFRYMGGRYIDTPMLNAFKKAWTGDEHIRDDRVTREGAQIPRPALTMGLGLQPELLRSLTKKESFRGEGIFGRFLAIQPPSPAGHRKTGEDVPELDVNAQVRYERNLRTLLETLPADVDRGEWIPHILTLSTEARARLQHFEEEIEEGLRTELDALKDWGGKLVGNTCRIAGLLHVASRAEEDDLWSEPVSGGAASAAIELARSLIPHAMTVFAEMAMDAKVQLQRYVLRRIKEAENHEDLTVRDVHRLCSGKEEIETVRDVKNVLRRLQKHNLVRIERRTSNNGRSPSDRVHLHPDVREEIDRTDRTPLSGTRGGETGGDPDE